MKNYLIAERYARGLSACITDAGELEAAQAATDLLSELYTTQHDLRSALANPAIDVGQRAAVLAEVLLVEECPRLVARLADVLLRRGRITLMPDVAVVFATIVDERLKRVTAAVTTAVGLNETQRGRLQNALGGFSGKTVRMEETVDAEILGGTVARIGTTVIDGSLRTRLERMKQALLAEET